MSFLQATHKNLYKYHAKEQYFGGEINETFEMTIQFGVYCKSGKKYQLSKHRPYKYCKI